jgi:predicted CxxxxCH...CXXCH cytochrome family protein
MALISACSNLKNNIPTEQAASVHAGANTDTAAGDFHGKLLAANSYNFDPCKNCHGASLTGGTTNHSCFDAKCHETGELHKVASGIADTTSPNFHGNLLAREGFSLTRCRSCHGADLSGNSYPTKNCYQCHSKSEVHGIGIADPSSADFHGKIVSTVEKWSYKTCIKCHGSDYKGGLVGKSCTTCHTQTAGPEACNTCHGDFSDPAKIAPPRALDGSIATTSRGVGAHAAHLFPKYSAALSCTQCHKVPTKMSDAGHINPASSHATIVFGSLSSNVLDGTPSTIKPNPSYDTTKLSCSGVYCHGTMKSGNTANAPVWTGSATCGSCHGDGANDPLPKDGQPWHDPTKILNARSCFCHGNVSADASYTNYTIIDKTKHVNGVVDFSAKKK